MAFPELAILAGIIFLLFRYRLPIVIENLSVGIDQFRLGYNSGRRGTRNDPTAIDILIVTIAIALTLLILLIWLSK